MEMISRHAVACDLPDDPAQSFIGSSLAAASVRQQIRRVANSCAPAFLSGPSGGGKEVVARAIHNASPRRKAPFLAIDCGTLAGDMASSTLFGHLRGSFTGCIGDRAGAFVEAQGGTLFLDEIGNMPAPVQAQLLRTLELAEVRPVGSTRTRQVDVRLIAATNASLVEAVRAGQFRQDLLFRINVLHIRLPSLADRRQDIPALAEHLLEGLARRAGRHAVLTAEALCELSMRDWPGNVRQLRSALEYALAMTDDEVIDREHLSEPETTAATGTPPLPWRRWRDEQERQLIVAHLEQAGGNRSAAARALGLSRQTLHDKLRRFDLGRKPPMAQADVVHER